MMAQDRKEVARVWCMLGALLLACAVILGAFGAHGLKGKIEPAFMEIFEKAVFYHLTHTLGLMIVTLLFAVELIGAKAYRIISALLVCGICIFSGSLYALVLSGVRAFGAITPIGGSCLIAAWGYLLYAVWNTRGAARVEIT